MLQSYSNPIIRKSKITPDLARTITAEGETDWGKQTVVEYVFAPLPPREETIEVDETTIIHLMTGNEELEKTRRNFIANFDNLRKYPKMNAKDWE